MHRGLNLALTLASASNRMPVLFHPNEHDNWFHGSIDDVIAFQVRCFLDELIEMGRTAEPWNKRKDVTPTPTLL